MSISWVSSSVSSRVWCSGDDGSRGQTLLSPQTEKSSLLAPNASVVRKCCLCPLPSSYQTSLLVPNASVTRKCCSILVTQKKGITHATVVLVVGKRASMSDTASIGLWCWFVVCRKVSIPPACVLLYGASSASAGPITMHAAVASECTNVSMYVVKFTGVGVCSPRPAGHCDFCKYELAYGLRRTGR